MFEIFATLAQELTPEDRARHLKAIRELREKFRLSHADNVRLRVEMIAKGRNALARACTALADQNVALAQECALLEAALA